MSSPASGSKAYSSSFQLLDYQIQEWIWKLGWTELRDIQEQSIPAILSEKDIIISASTASGKTEAAFFPILSKLVSDKKNNASALYISPLKALINDQWERLDILCERLDIAVTPWHGDISQTKKKRFINKPGGCILITPESLEALLMHYGGQVKSLFAGLQYCVIDELHSFMGTERGKQLQCLLHRLDIIVDKKIPRVALSATLGDMNMAAEFLLPTNASAVKIISSDTNNQELKVAVWGYKIERPEIPSYDDKSKELGEGWVSARLFSALRGSNNLVFPNTRAAVEIYADELRKLCEEAKVPNEFWPHHGNLSKEIREETEQALKKQERPATAICTNTLELGIDIGAVKSVAQIGPPPAVASLRQRIGRSGRRKGEAAILRAYCIENAVDSQSPLSDLLREQLIQTIAMIRLLAKGWCEPIAVNGMHLSTLIQQLLSCIAQYGGITAKKAWDFLCETGPFTNVSRAEFLVLLQSLGQHEIISQDHTGLLLIGGKGEKLINHYSFYAAFSSDKEYRLICQGKTLGTLPISWSIVVGSYLIFAGRRWRIEEVDDQHNLIVVLPDRGGKAPKFFGCGSKIHDKVRAEMREVLQSEETIPFLDKVARGLLEEARFYYRQLVLNENVVFKKGKEVCLFPWKGDNVQDTLALMFTERGYKATNEGLFISIDIDAVELVYDVLLDIAEGALPSIENLVSHVENTRQEKWDYLVPDGLLEKNYASLYLDVDNARKTAMHLVKSVRMDSL